MHCVREAELWARLNRHLGADYARVWAGMQALGELDSRTVLEALADGIDAKSIWRACWVELELPFQER